MWRAHVCTLEFLLDKENYSKKLLSLSMPILCSQKQNHARIALLEVGKKSKGSLIVFRLEKNKCRETLCNLSHVSKAQQFQILRNFGGSNKGYLNKNYEAGKKTITLKNPY